MMLPAPEGVPTWAWKSAAYVVGGILTALTTILGWLGKRYVTKRDEQIEELKRKMETEHNGVGGEVDRVRRKIERTEEKVDRLLQKIDG